jgi:hypothetical protein
MDRDLHRTSPTFKFSPFFFFFSVFASTQYLSVRLAPSPGHDYKLFRNINLVVWKDWRETIRDVASATTVVLFHQNPNLLHLVPSTYLHLHLNFLLLSKVLNTFLEKRLLGNRNKLWLTQQE